MAYRPNGIRKGIVRACTGTIGGIAAVDGNEGGALAEMHKAGIAGENAAKDYIRSGNHAPNSGFTLSGGWMRNRISGKPFYPIGYVDALSEQATVVRSDETTYLTATNITIQGRIQIIKTDDEWGRFMFTRFDYGTWIIREVAAQEGFIRMKDVYLTVDESWVEPEPLTLVNIPNHYEFVKTDHEGNPMAGVKFTLEDTQGTILCDLVSGEDGIVHVTDLAPGSYTIREIETLEGFTRTEESIQVTISEQYIVPDEMFHLVNYPIIQTGVDADLNLGAGAVLAGCSMMLLVLYFLLKKKIFDALLLYDALTKWKCYDKIGLTLDFRKRRIALWLISQESWNESF